MKNYVRIISMLLIVCMAVMVCPLVSSAGVAYRTNKDGSVSLGITNGSGSASDYQYEIKDGVGGKLSEDKVYFYASETANSGKAYFSVKSTQEESVHDADSSVVEFSFFLKDEKSAFYVTPSFYNSKGYDYFLANGKHSTESGKGYTKSHSAFLRFNSKGIYVTKTGDDDYIDSAYRNKFLSSEPLKVGVWHTVAIKLPGLTNSKGEPKYDEDNNVIEGAYAGGREVCVAIDGREYIIPMNCDLYGTRFVRFHGLGELYLDNLTMYLTTQLSKPEDYINSTKLPEISVEGNGVRLKDDAVMYSGDITASALRSMIKGADAVRVYEDSTYGALVSDDAFIKPGNRVVVSAKNGCDTEKAFGYYSVAEQQGLEVSGISLTDAEGKVIEGQKLSSAITIPECYVKTNIVNNTAAATEPLRVIVASYDKNGAMTYYKSKELTVQPGELNISETENAMKFENIPVAVKGKLKAFLLYAETGAPLCDKFEVVYGSAKEYHILSFGNSYTNDSFEYLAKIAAKDGVTIKAVCMYKGSCGFDQHYTRMNNSSSVYEKMIEYTASGKTSVENPTFNDGLLAEGYSWDYITLHQRGRHSCFFNTFYTDEKPYITALASYIRENSPQSEVLFFGSWAPYTDRIEEKYEDYNYKAIVEGYEKSQYYPVLFNEIKNTYLTAAEKIGNPGRVIPAGEALYLAVTKYGFADRVVDSQGNFVSGARSIYRDTSSHLTTYGKLLSALTWYEYLTGNDARENSYTVSSVSEADMKLLREIAHEACSQPEYAKK